MRLPSLQDWLFSIVTFAAAALALYIAFEANLDRPYWAAGTVFIVAQRTTGALNAKAIWRLVGTLCGACFAIAAVPNLVNSPPLLIAAFVLWISVCLAGSLLDGSLRSYAFMLAGYTAAIIGFPSVDRPDLIFDVALSRVEEVSLGIVCCHILHFVLLSSNVHSQLQSRIAAWMGDLARYISDLFHQKAQQHLSHATWRRLAMHVSAIEQIFDEMKYEGGEALFVRNMHALPHKLRRVSLLMTSVSARMVRLQSYEPKRLEAIRPLIEEVGQWLVDSLSSRIIAQSSMQSILRHIENRPELRLAENNWSNILVLGILLRLKELVALWDQCGNILHGNQDHLKEITYSNKRRGHIDPLLVFLSSASVSVSLISVCLFWRYGAWPSGGSAAIMVTIVGSLFAHMDDPAPAIGSFLFGNFLAVVAAGTFLFGIFPAIDGFPLLVYSLAILFIPAVAFLRQPDLSPWLRPMIICTFPTMGLQETYNADFSKFINNGIATFIGIVLVLVVTLVIRSMDSRKRIARLVQADRNDLAALASGLHDEDAEAALDRMLDRFEAVATRLEDEASYPFNMLEFGALRASLNIMNLRRNLARLDQPVQETVINVLAAVSAYARARITDKELINILDQAISKNTSLSKKGARDAILELVGIRLALFPEMSPPSL